MKLKVGITRHMHRKKKRQCVGGPRPRENPYEITMKFDAISRKIKSQIKLS